MTAIFGGILTAILDAIVKVVLDVLKTPAETTGISYGDDAIDTVATSYDDLLNKYKLHSGS